VLENFIKKEVVRNWSDAELKALSTKHCRQVGIWNGAIVTIDPELQKRIKDEGKQPTQADKVAALRIAQQAPWKRTAHLAPEESIVQEGGHLLDSPTQVIHRKLDTTIERNVNSPIPVAIDQTIERPSLPHVAAFCSQIVKQSGGKWEPEVRGLSTVLGQDGINIIAAGIVSALVINFINDDPVWKSKVIIDKNATTGIRALTFVRDVLSRIPDTSYYYLTTMIVIDVLRALIKEDDQWSYRMADAKTKAVPEKCYRSFTMKGAAARSAFAAYPCSFDYLGGYLPLLDIPMQNGTLASAVASLQKLRIVAGGDGSTIFLLSSMRGMSGYSSEFGQRIQFLLSATLGLWMQNHLVDIRLSTIGDFPVLQSSLTYWKQEFQALKKGPGHADWFKFLAPTRAPISLPVASKILFVSAHRENAVAVWYSASNLPTSGEKKVAVDYDAMSADLIPGDVYARQFVAYSAIYGCVPFQEDKEVKKVNNARVYPIDKTCYAFQFGSSARFRGVISSFRAVNLIGYGWEKKEGVYDVSKDAALVTQVLTPAFVQSDWYNYVSKDCAAAYCSMFGTVQRYSPISSLVFMSKKAVQLSLTVGVVDGDAYVSEVLIRQRKVQGVKFVVPDAVYSSDSEDDEVPLDNVEEEEAPPILSPTLLVKKTPKQDLAQKQLDVPLEKLSRKQRDVAAKRLLEQQQQKPAFVAPLDLEDSSTDEDDGEDPNVAYADISDQ